MTYGCTQLRPRQEHEEVSLNAALNQAQASYLRGCVEAFKTFSIAPSFPSCVEKSLAHRLELIQIMDQ